jgi:cytochrome P450
LQANAIWAAYWIFVFQLQRPEGLTPLINEVDRARESWVAKQPDAKAEDNISDFAADGSFPLLASTIQEALRSSSFVFSIRDVEESLELGGYQLDKGERVICATRSVHLDEEIHENAQNFVPDRYLNTKTFMKDGKPVRNHTLPFGGGVSQCEGRYVDSFICTLCPGRPDSPL